LSRPTAAGLETSSDAGVYCDGRQSTKSAKRDHHRQSLTSTKPSSGEYRVDLTGRFGDATNPFLMPALSKSRC
jgi:hypothetical protein